MSERAKSIGWGIGKLITVGVIPWGFYIDGQASLGATVNACALAVGGAIMMWFHPDPRQKKPA